MQDSGGRRIRGILAPAYVVVVPLEFDLEAPLHGHAQVAMPRLEAVEHASLREGVPVDARIERGRTPIDALHRLWAAEQLDRILVPARAPGHPGIPPKDVSWMLEHAPQRDARPPALAGRELGRR